MRIIFFITMLFTLACQTSSEKVKVEKGNNIDNIKVETSIFDSTLAVQYEADNYGMKPYIMTFLMAGPNPPKDSAHAVELQAAHMENIGRLADEGKLVLAGPFYGENRGDHRGIYIFNTANLDSAKAYTESDPAIKWGSLKMELINWYGSAALMGINEVHSKIAKEEI